jgi:hypothetical protein
MKIYHITHIDNLLSILQEDRLLAHNNLDNKYTNIAYNTIQDRRAMISVPYAGKGTLHDYVPFYFAPRSPMLFTINKGNVQSYNGGQQQIIYFVVEIAAIAEANIPYTFTDGHPVMAYSSFCEDLNYLTHIIDWELMESRYWFDTDEDPDRKRRRQAEFLIYQQCPWRLVREIGVKDSSMKTKVINILQQYNDQTLVTIHNEWYF